MVCYVCQLSYHILLLFHCSNSRSPLCLCYFSDNMPHCFTHECWTGSRDEADEFVEIGALNGIFVLGRSMGFIGESHTVGHHIRPSSPTCEVLKAGHVTRACPSLGHYLDQKRLKQGLYRHPWDDISYVLPEHMSMWSPTKWDSTYMWLFSWVWQHDTSPLTYTTTAALGKLARMIQERLEAVLFRNLGKGFQSSCPGGGGGRRRRSIFSDFCLSKGFSLRCNPFSFKRLAKPVQTVRAQNNWYS